MDKKTISQRSEVKQILMRLGKVHKDNKLSGRMKGTDNE